MIKNYLLIIALFFLYSCESINNYDRVKSRYSNVESLDDLIDQEGLSQEEESLEAAINGDLAKKVHYKNGKYEGYYKVGKPYKIYGIKYTPKNYSQLDQTGVASWYGDAFHGKKTSFF